MRSIGRSLLIALAFVASQIIPVNAVVRIMPLGDSITEWGCWRAKLWHSLSAAGYDHRFTFVGSKTGNQCPGYNFNPSNEGHAGRLAIDIANQNLLPQWLWATRPDIVLVHLGTNDIGEQRSLDEIITAFHTLVSQMRDVNPNMIILIAKIIPRPIWQMSVNPLNNRIDLFAHWYSTPQSPIVVVDQNTGYNPYYDSDDGIHPNASGETKIANKWLEPLKAAINFAEARGVGH